jgi:peptidoglycan biosynthesis protein MviN/MurJ (putative lipid II flippase)
MIKQFKNIINKASANQNTHAYLLVILTTFFAKFLGMIKQPYLISKLGGNGSDLFLTSDKPSQIIAAFLVGGTIYSSILPSFTVFYSKSNETYQEYLKTVGTIILALVFAVSVFFGLTLDTLLPLFVDSKTLSSLVLENQYANFIFACRVLLTIPTFMAAQTVLGVYLNLKKEFFWFNFSSVVTNLSILCGLFLYDSYLDIALFSAFGWLFSCLIVLFVSIKNGLSFTFFDLKNSVVKYKNDITDVLKLMFSKIFLLDVTTVALILIVPFKQFEGQIAAFDLGLTIQNSLVFLMLSYNYVLFPQLSLDFHSISSSKRFQENTKKLIKINFIIGVVCIIFTLFLGLLITFVLQKIGKIGGLGDYIRNVMYFGLPIILLISFKDIVLKYLQIQKDIKITQLLNLLSLILLGCTFYGLILMKLDSGYSLIFALMISYLPWIYYLLRRMIPILK